MALSKDRRIEKAKRLRGQEGLTYREIGERLGVSTRTAYRYVNPGVEAKDRATAQRYKDRNREALRAYHRRYNQTHKGECPQCGGEMDRSTVRRGGKCEGCHADDVHRRAGQIEGWWAADLPLKEIAANLGWSLSRLSVEMHQLREAGYRLPYRSVHRKPRFPEQVAA